MADQSVGPGGIPGVTKAPLSGAGRYGAKTRRTNARKYMIRGLIGKGIERQIRVIFAFY
jgi:hypothetical protein